MKAPTVTQLKIAAVVVLVLVAIIIIVQNTETVETRLLFVSVSMPRAVLLLVTFFAGLVLGLILAARLGRKARGMEARKEEPQPAGERTPE